MDSLKKNLFLKVLLMEMVKVCRQYMGAAAARTPLTDTDPARLKFTRETKTDRESRSRSAERPKIGTDRGTESRNRHNCQDQTRKIHLQDFRRFQDAKKWPIF